LSRQSNQNERTIAYLLETLSDEERSRIEERYFSDDAEFEELEIAEDELIDSYVRGELSSTESQQFEKRMSQSPRLVQRVEFARMWAKKMAAPAREVSGVGVTDRKRDGEEAGWWKNLFGFSGEARAPRLAVAFTVLLLLLGGAALLVGWLKLREESRQLASQQAALDQRQKELDRQAADLKAQAEQLARQGIAQPSPIEAVSPPKPEEPAGPAILTLALSPGATRGDSGRSIRISPTTSQVAFNLDVRDTDYSSYQATVLTVDRTPVSSSGPLRLRRSLSGATLSFSVPAKRLAPGDYIVNVDGTTSTGTKMSGIHYYRFRVTR
jgi:Flp pilus assembly protein TadG